LEQEGRKVEDGLRTARFSSIQDVIAMVKLATQISRSGGLCFWGYALIGRRALTNMFAYGTLGADYRR
jgi:hypothetical protein